MVPGVSALGDSVAAVVVVDVVLVGAAVAAAARQTGIHSVTASKNRHKSMTLGLTWVEDS